MIKLRNILKSRSLFLILFVMWESLYLSGSLNLPFISIRVADAKGEGGVAENPRIAVVDLGGRVSEESVRKNIATALRTSFEVSSILRPVSEQQVSTFISERRSTDRQTRLDAIKKALKLLRDGKVAYQQMRMEEAEERLSIAKREFIENLNELKNNESLLDTYLYLGMTYYSRGMKDEAYAEFKKVIILDSKKIISTKEFSPAVVKLFEKARQEIDSLARGTVLIDSIPSASNVYINAKGAGTTPINMTLPVGEYFVKVEKQGYLDYYQLVSIEDKVNSIDIELSPVSADEDIIMALRPVSSSKEIEPASKELLTEIARKLSCQVIFLGWINRDVRDMIMGQLYDARTGKLSYSVQSSLGKNFSSIDNGVAKLVADLAGMVDSRGFVIAMDELPDASIPIAPAPKPPTPEQIALEKKKDWKGKWWVWALLGGIAAGAGIGIYVGVSSSGGGKITVNNQGNF